MTRDELRHLIADVQQHQSELANVEVKAARGGTPKRLYESLSAFANRTGGGVLLFGLDEAKDFAIVGVGDAQLVYVREHGSINNAECRELLHVDLQRASYLLKKLATEGVLQREKGRRWARYRLP